MNDHEKDINMEDAFSEDVNMEDISSEDVNMGDVFSEDVNMEEISSEDVNMEETEEMRQINSLNKCIEQERIEEGKRAIHEDGDMWNFLCPHCNQFTEVMKTQVNCKIFRHAVYRHNMEPINPHTPKEICDKLVADNLVMGCARPFKFVFSSEGNYVEICNYI